MGVKLYPLAARLLRWLRLLFTMLRLRLSRRAASRERVRRLLADQLAAAGGISMKVGQVFADMGEAAHLAPLMSGIPARKLKAMLPALASEGGHPTRSDFLYIDSHGRAASLGQVHRAELRNGDVVALKLQYPNIAASVAAELKLAGLLPQPGKVKRWGVDVEGYKRALADNMARELDYQTEAMCQQRFYDGLHIEGLVIPRPYPELCSTTALVQSWEEGEYFDELSGWSQAERMFIGRTLLATLLQSLFVLGEVHGDPHKGNMLFRRTTNRPEVVLLDFGSTVRVTPEQRLALLRLIMAVRSGEPVDHLAAWATIGFDPEKLRHIKTELPHLGHLLFRPFLDDTPFEPANWGLREGVETLLGERRWWFRSAGPSELFLLMRAFQGLVRQLQRLEVRLPWWPLLERVVGEGVRQQARELPLITVGTTDEPPAFIPLARELRVTLMEGERVVVELTLPAEAALNLDELIPPAALQQLRYSGDYDADAIHRRLEQSRLAPQQVLTGHYGQRQLIVWLE